MTSEKTSDDYTQLHCNYGISVQYEYRRYLLFIYRFTGQLCEVTSDKNLTFPQNYSCHSCINGI